MLRKSCLSAVCCVRIATSEYRSSRGCREQMSSRYDIWHSMAGQLWRCKN